MDWCGMGYSSNSSEIMMYTLHTYDVCKYSIVITLILISLVEMPNAAARRTVISRFRGVLGACLVLIL